MKIPSLLLALALALPLPVHAVEDFTKPLPPKDIQWPFEGVFGAYDRGELQRGFQVYKEVCSACHSLDLVAFHDLAAPGGPGFTEAQAKAIAAAYKIPAEPDARGELYDEQSTRLTRPGLFTDHFPAPYANEQAARAANSGMRPPDLSLIVKARKGGANYVYSLLTGFNRPQPVGFALPQGKYYNPYFAGRTIGMAPPLTKDLVAFSDGTPATVENEARAAAAFLTWTADPNLEARHRIGLQVMAFLVLLTGLFFLSYRKIWFGKKQDTPEVGDPDSLSGG